MKPIEQPLNRGELVYQAIVDEICDGGLPAGTHLVQDQLAERLGVSRQPVQQAMARLKADGLVEDVGRRGVCVTRLDLHLMRHHYDIRAVLDGLAARDAARLAKSDRNRASAFRREGESCLADGERALASGSIREQIRADEAFHKAIYGFCDNRLIERTVEPHWRFLRRAMGDVLRFAETPASVWQQHAAILEAICAGDAPNAERLAVEHGRLASEMLYRALARRSEPVAAEQQ